MERCLQCSFLGLCSFCILKAITITLAGVTAGSLPQSLRVTLAGARVAAEQLKHTRACLAWEQVTSPEKSREVKQPLEERWASIPQIYGQCWQSWKGRCRKPYKIDRNKKQPKRNTARKQGWAHLGFISSPCQHLFYGAVLPLKQNYTPVTFQLRFLAPERVVGLALSPPVAYFHFPFPPSLFLSQSFLPCCVLGKYVCRYNGNSPAVFCTC